MGYSQAQKLETHRRIVEIAAKRFLELGLDGIGVADVMKEAGVTVGGFYKHFRSREDLVVQAVQSTGQQLQSLEDRSKNIIEFIDLYLSESHRDNRGGGCPIGALVGDAGKSDGVVKAAYTVHVEQAIGFIESLLIGDDASVKRSRALTILSACVGGVNLARAVADPVLSKNILDSVSEQLVAMLGEQENLPVAR